MTHAAAPYVAVIGPVKTASPAQGHGPRPRGRDLARPGRSHRRDRRGPRRRRAQRRPVGAAAGGTSVARCPASTGPLTRRRPLCTPTGLGRAAQRPDRPDRGNLAVICVALSWGTLSEVALAVRTGVPVVTLATWLFRDWSDRGGRRSRGGAAVSGGAGTSGS